MISKLYNLYTKNWKQINTIITISSSIIMVICLFLIVVVVIFILKDYFYHRKETYLQNEIPKIIELSKNIQNIVHYVDTTIEIFEDDIPPINEAITKDTLLTSSQLNFLKFIKNLENYQDKWDYYSFSGLIQSLNIESPYRVAYHIRSILEIPFVKDIDSNDIDVWLSKDEIECINSYETNVNKLVTIEQPIIENYEHISICVKCKELITEEEAENLIKTKNETVTKTETKTDEMNPFVELYELLNSRIQNQSNQLNQR